VKKELLRKETEGKNVRKGNEEKYFKEEKN